MSSPRRVRVPGSTANLGPAFDAVGMALTVHIEVATDGRDKPGSEDHPAVIAFRKGGGVGPLSVRSAIPLERGLGFSGAARVAGLLAAGLGTDEVLELATAMEGHADNVAPSLFGGVVAVAAGRAVSVPLGFAPAVVVWVPSTRTSTARSRRALDRPIDFADAVFNVGRTALLVAALAAGDAGALRTATEDRLHQSIRLADRADSRAAIDAALNHGALAAWLSGSGPSIAALVEPHGAATLAAALPESGRCMVLFIDRDGAVVDS